MRDQSWLEGWSRLLGAINQDPYAAARTVVDIINEPEGRQLGWDEAGALYHKVMQIGFDINPREALMPCLLAYFMYDCIREERC